MSPHHARLTLEELRSLVAAGEIDTVVLALTDMQGRLQGKRIAADYFLAEVVAHGGEGCDYLLAVDVDMNTVDGYAISSWDTRLRRPGLRPRPGHAAAASPGTRAPPWCSATSRASTARRCPSRPGRCCAASWTGWRPAAGTPTWAPSWSSSSSRTPTSRPGTGTTSGLTPVNQYNVDYSVLGTGRVEPLLRRIRNEMAGAGLTVESAKGECNPGQHEIAFRYGKALIACDDHAVYKTGAKEIAAQEGMSLTFMAKYNEREGNSCHIHLSLRDGDGAPCMAGRRPHGFSPVMEHFLAGQLACLADFALLLAPERQLLQALRRRQLRAHRHRLGPRQPHLRAAGGRARRRRCGSRTGSPAATSTRTWRWPP